MKTCICSLAGTAACKTCHNNYDAGYDAVKFEPITVERFVRMEYIDPMELRAERDRYKADADYYKRLAEAAENFIQARISLCVKSHICNVDELQVDFETYTKYNAIKNEREGRR